MSLIAQSVPIYANEIYANEKRAQISLSLGLPSTLTGG